MVAAGAVVSPSFWLSRSGEAENRWRGYPGALELSNAMTQLPDPARFRPYEDLGSEPNNFVDATPAEGTVLTLSHWPRVATAPGLLGDTSTELTFSHLENPELHSTVGVVSNNHFDEDGLFSMFCLIDPEAAIV